MSNQEAEGRELAKEHIQKGIPQQVFDHPEHPKQVAYDWEWAFHYMENKSGEIKCQF